MAPVQVALPDPRRPEPVTVTLAGLSTPEISVVRHPAAGTLPSAYTPLLRTPVTVTDGPAQSSLTWTDACPVFPARSVQVAVTVAGSPSLYAPVCWVQSWLLTVPLSVQFQFTATGEMYQPSLPRVPLTVGAACGGVVSSAEKQPSV